MVVAVVVVVVGVTAFYAGIIVGLLLSIGPLKNSACLHGFFWFEL